MLASSIFMTAWSERSRTQAIMLNPALLAVIVANAALQYRANSEHGMPWPLAFIVAPLVLHRGTRDSLPRTTRANLGLWVADHPVEHAGFARRARSKLLKTQVLKNESTPPTRTLSACLA